MRKLTLLFVLLIPFHAHSLLREMNYGELVQFENQNRTFLKNVPAQFTSSVSLWSDYYWPDNKGGVAWRWQHSGANDPRPSSPFRYKKLTVQELVRMSDTELSELSPAEKFDIFNGRFNFPTLAAEIRRIKPGRATWQGVCDGVAVANQIFKEPKIRTVKVNIANQIKNLTFYPSDIKALLAMATSAMRRPDIIEAYMGTRCESGSVTSSGSCWDVNPANFLIALINQVAALNSTFAMDVDPTFEVWNSVVQGFDVKMTPRAGVSARAAEGTVRELKVDLTVRHLLGVKPSKNPSDIKFGFKTYAFTIEISEAGEIIGGEWLSANRPDFLWRVKSHFEFDQDMRSLECLVERR